MILVVVHHGKTRLKWCCKQARSPEQWTALESSLLFLWPFIDGVEVIGILVHCAAVRQKYQQNSSSQWKSKRLDLNPQLSAFIMMMHRDAVKLLIGQRYHDHLKNLLQPGCKQMRSIMNISFILWNRINESGLMEKCYIVARIFCSNYMTFLPYIYLIAKIQN